MLIWQGGRYRHIAVIDHVIPDSDPLRMLVVESSGSTGLAANEYQITGRVGTSDVFHVDRGIGARQPSRVKFVQVQQI